MTLYCFGKIKIFCIFSRYTIKKIFFDTEDQLCISYHSPHPYLDLCFFSPQFDLGLFLNSVLFVCFYWKGRSTERWYRVLFQLLLLPLRGCILCFLLPQSLLVALRGLLRRSLGCPEASSKRLPCFPGLPPANFRSLLSSISSYFFLLYLEFILAHMICLTIHVKDNHTLFIF